MCQAEREPTTANIRNIVMDFCSRLTYFAENTDYSKLEVLLGALKFTASGLANFSAGDPTVKGALLESFHMFLEDADKLNVIVTKVEL